MDHQEHEDNYKIDEEDSDDEDDGWEFNMDIFQRLKQNDPSVTNVYIPLNYCFYNKYPFINIDWKEDGDCISNNTQLKEIFMCYSESKMRRLKLPSRQQIQDLFSCVYRSRSINIFGTQTIINEEFSASLIEGLQGHPSIEIIVLEHSEYGGIVFSALGKVLKHPRSNVKDLRLSNCELDDNNLKMLCNALLGSSTLKKLSLYGKTNITHIGWKALSTVLHHPNCKLVQLDLRSTLINDDVAIAIGGSSSLKALGLTFNRKISSDGWQTLFKQLSQTTIEHLDLRNNSIEIGVLSLLGSIKSLKSVNLSQNRPSSSTPTDWWSFFSTLQARGTQLVKLNINGNDIGNEGIPALGNLLSNMRSLKILKLNGISHTITSQGWVSFFTTLQGSNFDLVKLDLSGNSIDDEGMQLLVSLVNSHALVSSMTTPRHLSLSRTGMVTPAGWQAFSSYLQSPNFALKSLDLDGNNINDDTIISFSRALVHNKTLKWLSLYDNVIALTERGWSAFSTLLCNKSSIMDTYNSNHILQDLGCERSYSSINEELVLSYSSLNGELVLPDDLVSYLELNKNEDKAEVSRQKILQTGVPMQEFLDMELEVMPTAIAWIGRPSHDDWTGTSVSGLSTMYNFMRRLPNLFDTSAQKKTMGKRKSKADL